MIGLSDFRTATDAHQRPKTVPKCPLCCVVLCNLLAEAHRNHKHTAAAVWGSVGLRSAVVMVARSLCSGNNNHLSFRRHYLHLHTRTEARTHTHTALYLCIVRCSIIPQHDCIIGGGGGRSTPVAVDCWLCCCSSCTRTAAVTMHAAIYACTLILLCDDHCGHDERPMGAPRTSDACERRRGDAFSCVTSPGYARPSL